MKQPAIILTVGKYHTPNGKGAHGLVRGSERFEILAVVDEVSSGHDAGELLDGRRRGIPVVASLGEALALGRRPRYAIVGIATHGGHFTAELRRELLKAINAGLGIVNGLHDAASEDPELAEAASASGAELIDLRKPKPKRELHFWTGAIFDVRAPRLAVLGTDCALGKRTTTRLLVEALAASGLRAEMIYTGQTGWMQGARYGFVLDSVINDFVSGELEHAIVACDRVLAPDVMVIEGQSALRNPSGPCGAEFLVSGAARGVILQHAPGREFYEGYEHLPDCRIPPIEDEIALIRHYGARTLGLALNGHRLAPEALAAEATRLEAALEMPVVRPVEEGVERLLPVVRAYLEEERR